MKQKIIKVFKKKISKSSKTYFVADIAANHDGNLSRALKLIRLCAKSGADAAKFQHFKAETIVSDYGFKKMGKITHQKKWKKSVYEIYNQASIKIVEFARESSVSESEEEFVNPLPTEHFPINQHNFSLCILL